MRVESIEIEDLRPFLSGEIEFPESTSRGNLGEMHVFTGPNGTGKSRLLSLLAASTIDQSPPNLERFPEGIQVSFTRWRRENQIAANIDSANKRLCKVITTDASFLGFAFAGAMVMRKSELEILKGDDGVGETERLSFDAWAPNDVNQRIANLKIQAAMEHMNLGSNATGRSQIMVQRLESAITEVTGRRFALSVQAHPHPKIMFVWGTQTLPIEGLPAGLNSLMAWMLTAATIMGVTFGSSEDPLKEEAIFFLDEPETYLHPEWQRRILPMAQRLFPNSQFFVATHSPFVVSSINEGFIYKLTPDENGEVTISEAIQASKGDSYITAVSEILGLSEWFDPETEKLLAEFRQHRDAAIKGKTDAEVRARELAESIASRSQELANIMGMEIRQLDRQLENHSAAKP